MTSKLLGNKGGLHNRVTQPIYLRPFNLLETEQFLKSRGFAISRRQVAEAYKSLGGTPYYLDMMKKSDSIAQNIDRLFYSKEAPLKTEYAFLFKSLFKESTLYRRVVETLSKKMKGMTRQELLAEIKSEDNGYFSDVLTDLCNCDFVRRYNNGTLQKNGIYQLVDFFSLFHYRFGTRRVTDEHFWRNTLGTPEQNNWYGLTFERVCLWHVRQIVHGLRLDAIRHEYYAWRSQNSQPAVQIDLVIDRADGIVTICEMKYSKDDYTLSEKEYRNIVRRMETFQKETGHKGGVQVSLVTTYGLNENMYSEISPIPITMEELFG